MQELIIDDTDLSLSDLIPEMRSLTNLTIHRSRIESLAQDSFEDAVQLVHLNFTHNNISSLPVNFLTGLSKLQTLSLAHNSLASLLSYQFGSLPSLLELDLSHNNLSSVSEEAFARTVSLRVLRLEHNRLTRLGPETLLPLASLHMVSLSDNPWVCDCHLRVFRDTMMSLHLSSDMVCSAPDNVSGQLWSQVASHQFACPPQVTVKHVSIQTIIGETLSVQCDIKVYQNLIITGD